MKRAYFKDSRKMFKSNLFRYVSIVLIIMLGATFFIGMNSVAPEMKRMAEEYMEDKNVFDISLMSNMGYKDEDLDKFKENKRVKEIQGIYTYDVLAKFEEKDIAIKLTSLLENSEMNQNNITDGREIKKETECIVSSRLIDMYGYKIGDKIKFYLKDDTKLENQIKYTEFEIVGVTQNPMYLSKFYGNTKLLSGELNGYIMLKKDVFKQKNYTAVYIKTDIENDLDKFSQEYKEKLEEILPDIEKVNAEIAKEKFDKIYENTANTIQRVEGQVTDAEKYVKNAKKQIQAGQIKINDSIVQVSAGVSEYYNSNSMKNKLSERFNEISSIYDDINKKNEKKEKLEKSYNEIKPKRDTAKAKLDELENNLDKKLYEIYGLNKEESKFVELCKQIGSVYFDFHGKNEEYEKINEEYERNKKDLEESETEIAKLYEKLETSQNEMYSLFSELEDLTANTGNKTLIESCAKIKESKKELEESKKKLSDQNLEEKIAKVKVQISEKKEELSKAKPVTQETPLYKNSGFKSLKEDLSKIAIMGRIFPVMFFIVAALVTITTITRMIEEDRQKIGTLKALGYSKGTIKSRYIIYSLTAALLGTLLGTLLGSTLIVQILYVSYGSLYDLPSLITHINLPFTGIALAISLIATVFVTMIIISKSLKENAAELMRPKATKEGKNILLEKIPFIWKKMDFLYKICFRNIFRYKRRLCMTLVGIAGCTALIYAGLGLQSSINEIGEKQFESIRKVSMEVYLNQEMKKDEVAKIEEHVKNQQHVKCVTPVSQQSLTVEANDHEKDIFYIAINGEEANDYIGLQERKGKQTLELNDDGILITEKLAGILEVKVGDKINIKDGDVNDSVKITGITENYLYNYIYMTPKVYERIYGKEIVYNEIFVNTDEDLSEEDELKLTDQIKENDKVASVVLEESINEEFQTSLGSLMSIVILFVGCASLLSFIVLVNLNNINFEERKRELATLKLLGFYKRELQSYLFRENIILTIFGTICGLFLGIGILGIIIKSAEVETIFLAKDINIPNLAISSVMTICFTLITNMFMKRKIKRINMIDSLKSVE